MITFRAARAASTAALLLLLAACGKEQQDWRSAEAANTPEAYGRFIEQHGDSELAREARLRIAQMAEQAQWQQADARGTVEAYRAFIAQHPHGRWAEQARIRIEGFSLGSAPRLAQGPASPLPGRTGVNALQLATGVAQGATATGPAVAAPPAAASVVASADPDDLARPAPDTQETRPVPTAALGLPSSESDSGYGVQLGAFGSEASAGREWVRLKDRFGPELGGLAPRIVVASTGAGQLYRLQAPAGGEAQARALCAQLREQSQACVPVVPR
jgi:hypothetical protein